MRRALAPCALIATLAVATGAAAPHATQTTLATHAARARKPLVPVRAIVRSGDRQDVHAYVDVAATAYQTEFPKPLVVTVAGPPVPPNHPRHVVFTCVTHGCVLAPTEQHEFDDTTKRATVEDKPVANAYDARLDHGRAGVYVTVQATVTVATYTIRALPVANPGERAIPAWFTIRTH